MKKIWFGISKYDKMPIKKCFLMSIENVFLIRLNYRTYIS